jgi:hypothetical protein
MKFIKQLILNMLGGCEMFFIDRNRIKTIWSGRTIKKGTFKFSGGEFVIDRRKIKNNLCVYHSKLAEPVTIDYQENKKIPINFDFSFDKTVFYIDSKEFLNTYNNKLHKMMLYVREKQYIQYLLICAIIIIIMVGYALFMLYQMQPYIIPVSP